MTTNPRPRRDLPISVPLLAALLLVGAGALHYHSFNVTLKQNARTALEREWSAIKGYLRLERARQGPVVLASWYYDDRDPEESTAVTGIQQRCVIMDQAGRVLHEPPSLPELRTRLATMLNSLGPPDTTMFTEIRHDGATYLVRAGVLLDESRLSLHPAALAVRLSPNRNAFDVSLLGTVVGALILGWSIARRKQHTSP